MAHVEGYYQAIVRSVSTGEINGTRAVQVDFEIEGGETLGKTYFLNSRLDKGGKTGTERFREDLELLGWDQSKDVSCVVGATIGVKTRINGKGYPEVAFLNKPRAKSAPKWADDNWNAVAAMLGNGRIPSLKSAGTIGQPKTQHSPEDEDLPF